MEPKAHLAVLTRRTLADLYRGAPYVDETIGYVLRDNEGRAAADDLREAAEVAAFFSEARSASLVDVHVTRRKHVRPAKGGPGRVYVAHSDTLRVAPRDPEGRLRSR